MLQQRLGLTNPWDVARAAAEHPVQVYGFDLLAVAGYDLRDLPLAARKHDVAAPPARPSA